MIPMFPVPGTLSLKLIVGIGCALLLALLVHDRNHWKAKTVHYAEQLAGERAAHAATVANYRTAAEQARRRDAEHAARVRAGQTAIDQRSQHDYQSRIAVARAAAGRLRGISEAARADPGRSGGASVPALPSTARGIAQAAGENELPRSDRLTATEQAIQLDELIKWTRRQAEVDVERR